MLRIPAATLHRLAAEAPKTHELGGHFRVDADGTLRDTVVFEGEQCRDKDGNRISGGAQCRIHKPDAEISFHTHPKSNRPSSADMRNAVLKHPAVSGRGKRRLSLVLGPRGFWWYSPSPDMRRAWRARLRRGDKSFVKSAMRQWSKTGNRYARLLPLHARARHAHPVRGVRGPPRARHPGDPAGRRRALYDFA